MPAIKTAISFGLVHIPITLNTAAQDDDVHFNQLHKDTKERIHYKKTCPSCQTEVTSADIVKGFEYEDGQYVVITDDDIEKIKSKKDKTMQIMHFVELNQISPVYFDKSYLAAPENGSEKAFDLLKTALLQENKIAIAKTVLGTRETLIALIPRENGMLAQTMFFENEIKALPDYKKPAVNEQELMMAKQLISSMAKPFNPDDYQDEYQVKLKAMIRSKIEGKEIVSPTEEPTNVIDLMEALKQSLARTQAGA